MNDSLLAGWGEIFVGDCRETLRTLPEQSVHTCVTSPPYFGLRDYGHGDQIGLEPTPDEFVAALVEVFREVRRVLRDDGTLWLNLGDSYVSTSTGNPTSGSTLRGGKANQIECAKRPNKTGFGLDIKQLIGIPWRVAFALQADGWYLRQDIIWHKPNPMPESMTDRCTKAHEYIFLFSKSPKYYFDNEAIKENSLTKDARRPYGSKGANSLDPRGRQGSGIIRENVDIGKRNRRSVWTVTTKPFKGAHFATYPPDLIEPCILAGCPEGGTVLDPFFGAGTTGLVAQRNRRHWIGCELNADYAAMAIDRVTKQA